MKIKYLIVYCCLLFFVSCSEKEEILLIFTTDIHSQIDANEKGEGGLNKIASIVQEYRQQYGENMLLLDAGDNVQGSIYYNIYDGNLEFLITKFLTYDAITLGNHNFDNGINKLKENILHTNTPIVCANYIINDTCLQNCIQPYIIKNIGQKKIGIIGLGVNLEDFVADENIQKITYQNPIACVNLYADSLKHFFNCNAIIVLSHLGSKKETANICDVELIQNTSNIDIVLSGHSHIDTNVYINNINNKPVLLFGTESKGRKIGKILLSVD